MVETCVGPSELHLKKELTTLRKARFLRDPETCSSWRSPLSSRSVAATSILNCENGAGGNSKGVLNSGGLLELPSRSDNKWNKVYLYNWRYHSSKSSDSGIKLDAENMQGSVDGSPEDSLCIPQKKNSKDKTSLEAPVNVYSVRSNNPEIPVRRIVRKPRRNAMSRKRVIKHSAALRLLDLKSRSLAFNSVEHDDTEHSNSEDLQRSAYGPTQKTGYLSRSASPMFSRSGCGSWSCSSKMLRNFRREESSPSHTPASTSSYNRYGARNPSNVGSWDDTTASFDGDELDQLELPGRQGCGIPCYWSKRTKDRGFGGWSPSLSDTLKRKGSSILCGSQTRYHKKRLSSICMQKYVSKSSQGVPLLTNSCDGGGSSLDTVSDELSTNFGEIELEALSRLDGKRWSSCKSQEGMELALPEETAVEVPDHRNLSQKYRPSSFEDIIGQAIVVQSLHNAISRGRIAPAYLFQGPRGTGKTSTARIFAAALNCLSTEENKPCGFCRECAEFSSGNGPNVREVEATNQKGMDRIRYFLKCMTVATTFSQYKVFVIDECHLVSSKMWSAFMKHLEEPPPRVVFIFITIDPDNLPRTIVSRCQKYLFPKIKDIDIISRLRKISAEESLDVDLEALDLIALNSDGSLRDAETMLDQLSLLGKKITTSLVNDLIGVVSDEKLLDLLEIAMSSDTAETVKRSRELMDSGVDPMALMSQLAGLIMDIIAGTYQIAHSQPSSTVLGGRSLTESELERLQRALKILSDAEKQLRLSSERSTWFTAALLQLGTGHNLEPNRSSSSSKHSTGKMNGGDLAKETSFNEKNTHPSLTLQESNSIFVSRLTSGCSSPHGGPASHRRPLSEKSSDALPANSQSVDNSLLAGTLTDDANGKRVISCPDKLADIWRKCIERCHSKTLRQLLCAHGRLVSITETEFAGTLIAFIAFGDANIKSRVERFLSSITNSIEIVLKQNVEVRIGFLPENCMKKHSESPDRKHRDEGFLDKERKVSYGNVNGSADKERKKEKSLDYSDIMLEKAQEKCDNSLVADEGCQVASNTVFSSETNHVSDINNNTAEEIPIQRMHAAVIDEQRLESAWLQVAEKGTAGLVNLKLEKNQAFPHNGVSYQNQSRSLKASSMSSKHWEDELNCEIRTLRISDAQGHHEKLTKGRLNHLAISPSLLHSNSLATNFDKDNLGYESGPGCNGLFCWNTRKPCRGKVKQATHGRSQKTGRLSLFGQCGKLKTP